MLPAAGVLDEETRDAMRAGSRELDFRTLLRVLRERVADASGLIEDGSARNQWEPVLGRFIDSAEYRRVLRAQPLDNGAPDLIARATEAAAVALGWTSPEAAAQALASVARGRGGGAPAARACLPRRHPPAARRDRSRRRVDVLPTGRGGAAARVAGQEPSHIHALRRDRRRQLPLVRWPTTIGAWKSEKLDDGSEALRYKASPVGRFYWRDLVAAPAWFPPPTTPDRELVRRRADGAWSADDDAVGPGYRSAYGLVALLHHRAVAVGGGEALSDVDIRTHGSGNYRSILRGSSHGCHRLFNHLAIRLGSFILVHENHVRHGLRDEGYSRVVGWKGHALRLRADNRGYRYELVPPTPVDVLPGRTVRSKPAATIARPPAPGSPPALAPAPLIPQT